MSRILQIVDDDRPVPKDACWWSLLLEPNEDGYFYVEQLHVPDNWDGRRPWSYSIEYFDGRNDWSWPFDVKIKPSELNEALQDVLRPAIRSQRYFLRVLDVIPPSMGTGWFPQCKCTLGWTREPDPNCIHRQASCGTDPTRGYSNGLSRLHWGP
ncbi:hypothetical protein FHT44_004973 [Mycolicibacterium sp. BK634]|nr:hypothetical protein [Mycolicibacterium sp. BK634]